VGRFLRYNESGFLRYFRGRRSRVAGGVGATVGFSDVLVSDRPSSMDYTLRLSGYSDIDRLPGFQNVNATVDRFLTFLARLKYSRLLRSLGAGRRVKGGAMVGDRDTPTSPKNGSIRRLRADSIRATSLIGTTPRSGSAPPRAMPSELLGPLRELLLRPVRKQLGSITAARDGTVRCCAFPVWNSTTCPERPS